MLALYLESDENGIGGVAYWIFEKLSGAAQGVGGGGGKRRVPDNGVRSISDEAATIALEASVKSQRPMLRTTLPSPTRMMLSGPRTSNSSTTVPCSKSTTPS